ncbi:MAG: type II toxin-antitoxin system VapC family toxin [Phormidesmis sp.]
MEQSLLDTNILSYFLRGDTKVVSKVRDYRQHYSYLSFSIFTYYETKSGLLYRDTKNQIARFEQLAAISEIIMFEVAIADTASQIYADLRARGLLIAPVDLFIAATAIRYDYVLITANVKHFQNVSGLRYENWTG